MAIIELNVPNTHVARVTTAFADTFGYQTHIENAAGELVANTESKADFTKRMIARFVKDTVKAYEGRVAARAAEASADAINVT